MSKVKEKVEHGFAAWARFVYRNHWSVFIIIALLTGGIYTQLPKLKFDATLEGFLHPEDPILVDYNEFLTQFGRDDLVVVAIRPKEIFNLDFLKRLKAFQEELEKNVPYVEHIDSLINARSLRGENDQLIVEELMKNFPQTEQDIAIKDLH